MTSKLNIVDDALSINDGSIILSRWISTNLHGMIVIRNAFGDETFTQKVSAENPIETDNGLRDDASDVLKDIGSSWKSSGANYSSYFQWLFTGKSGEIVDDGTDSYYKNYGWGTIPQELTEVNVCEENTTSEIIENLPPNYNNVVSYFDGTIDYDNNLLIDKKSGYDAIINNIDFDITECIVGIPLASNATITFNANTPIVGGETIPIQLLYQNYDLLDQVFSRHDDRVVDGEKLIIPSRIADIAIYSTPITGQDLTNAITYFEVPDYTGATIVDGTSIQDAHNAASIGDILLVKSGNYLEVGGFDSLYITKAITIQGVGLVNITSPASTTVVRINSVNPTTLKGVKLDALNENSYCLQCSNNSDNIVSNTVMVGNTNYIYTSQVATISRCNFNTTGRGLNITGGSIQECNIDVAQIASINMLGGVPTVVKYNKFVGIVPKDIAIGIDGTFEIHGNIFNSDNAKITDSSTGKVGTISMLYNTFNNATLATSIIEIDVNAYDIIINNNIFNTPEFTPFLINIETSENVEIKNNTSTSSGGMCYISAINGQNVNTNVSFNNIVANHNTGYCIAIGSEISTVNDDKIISSIIGNSISGVNGETNSCHSIFVGHNINTEIAYNKVVNSGYGVVYKHTNGIGVGKQIHHNIFDNNLFNIRTKGVNNAIVVNNTLIAGSHTNNNIYHSNNDGVGTATDLVLKNNILTGIVNNIFVDTTNLDSDYNVFNNQTMNNNDISTWQGLGNDVNSREFDPLLNANYLPESAVQFGFDLGLTYIDIITDSSQIPCSIYTREQGDNKYIGAIARAIEPLDGKIISGTMGGGDLIVDWVRGDAGQQALADAYSIPNPITVTQMLAIDTSVIPENDFGVDQDQEAGTVSNWRTQPYEDVTFNSEDVTFNSEQVYHIKETLWS